LSLRKKKGEGPLHPQPEGWGIRDPPHSLCNKINRKQENILNIAGVIPSQANARGLEPNVWRDQYFYEWIKETDDLSKELKRERHIRSENLEGKINDLINYFVYNDLKKARWYQFWKIHIQEKAQP